MDIFIAVVIYLSVSAIWLNVLASMALLFDGTLEPFQRVAQMFIVWLVPLIGSGFVLHMVFEHSPEAIPKSWIPWPFRRLIFGKRVAPNRNRDDHELNTYEPSRRRHENNDFSESIGSDAGGDGGGGGD